MGEDRSRQRVEEGVLNSSPNDVETRQLYGRRHGRPLRRGRRVALGSLLPAVGIPVPPPGTALDPRDLFPAENRPLWLEIGFGGGEHLAAQAAANPGVDFIGCEPFVNGVAGLLKQAADKGLQNIRILAGDGRALLDALPDACLDRVFVLFPDPWPKKRHHRRRLLQSETFAALARTMADDAELRIGTDHMEYGRAILMAALAEPSLEWLAETAADWQVRPADWPESRYEAKARRAGRSSLYLCFRRRPRR